MNDIGTRIKEVRKQNNLTQKDFAKQLGISQTHVSKIEKEIENPSETILLFISYKFSVDLEWLKNGEIEVDLIRKDFIEMSFKRYNTFKNRFENTLYKMSDSELSEAMDIAISFFNVMNVNFFSKYEQKYQEKYLEYVAHIFLLMDILFVKAEELNKLPKSIDESEFEKYILHCNSLIKKIGISLRETINFALTVNDFEKIIE